MKDRGGMVPASREEQTVSLNEAATRFLAGLTLRERGAYQAEVGRFVRWFGAERPLSGLAAPEIANYAERLAESDSDYARKLEMVRAFLVCAKKQGWTGGSLAVHLRTRKEKPKVVASPRGPRETVTLTEEGYAELKAELDTLKVRRLQAIEEMIRAAADKDFRENAPLEAARENRGHIEGRIRELEETLKSGRVIDRTRQDAVRVSVGGSVVLQDLVSGEELRYTLVSPREVDPERGRISIASPIGKAIIGRQEGASVEISTPAGKLRYQIKKIEAT